MSSRKQSAQRKAPKQASPAVPTPKQLAEALVTGQVINRVLKAGLLQDVADRIDDVSVLSDVVQIFQTRLNVLTGVSAADAVILRCSAAALASQSQTAKKNPSKDSEKIEKYHFSKNQIKAIHKAIGFLSIKDENRPKRFMGILSSKLVNTQGVLSKDIVKDAAKIANVRFDDDAQEGIFYDIINCGFSESHDENPQEATKDESKPAENVASHDEGNESTEVKA